MANHLDLEEQEQLDQIKHFWKQYGNLITWALIAVLAAFAGWNGYQYWQRNRATQASAMYDEIDRAVKAADATRIDRAVADMKDKYGATSYAQQAGLLVARHYHAAGKSEAAKSALIWVAEQSNDLGYQAVARLRWVDLLMEAKSFDEALKQLGAAFPTAFEALVADRKGDILALQGKPAQAAVEYRKAYEKFEERVEYRRLVEVKLNALGIDPQGSSVAALPAAAASGASQ